MDIAITPPAPNDPPLFQAKEVRQLDKISIENLEVYAYHGVYPEENKLGQKFFLSLQLFIDTDRAVGQDDLISRLPMLLPTPTYTLCHWRSTVTDMLSKGCAAV